MTSHRLCRVGTPTLGLREHQPAPLYSEGSKLRTNMIEQLGCNCPITSWLPCLPFPFARSARDFDEFIKWAVDEKPVRFSGAQAEGCHRRPGVLPRPDYITPVKPNTIAKSDCDRIPAMPLCPDIATPLDGSIARQHSNHAHSQLLAERRCSRNRAHHNRGARKLWKQARSSSETTRLHHRQRPQDLERSALWENRTPS